MPLRRNAANPSRGPSIERVHLPRSHINVQYDTVLREFTHNGVCQKMSMLTLSLSDVASHKPRPPAPQQSAVISKPAEISYPTEAGFTASAATAIAVAAANVSTSSESPSPKATDPSDPSVTIGTVVAAGGDVFDVHNQGSRCDDIFCSDKQIDMSTQTKDRISSQGPENDCCDIDSNATSLQKAGNGKSKM
jgi:hypothetical protein